MKSALLAAFRTTEHNFFQYVNKLEGGAASTWATAGSTSCVVFLYGPDEEGRLRLVTANAGDSRAVLSRSRQAVPLSEDHKPNLPREKDRIQRAGGHVERQQVGTNVQYRVNGNLNLSRAIGDLAYKKRSDLPPEEQIICSTPDVLKQERTPEDEFVILACDGVWDVLSNQEACDFVRERLLEKMDVAKVGVELLDRCISPDPQQTQGLGTDNMTAVVVKFSDAPAWAA